MGGSHLSSEPDSPAEDSHRRVLKEDPEAAAAAAAAAALASTRASAAHLAVGAAALQAGVSLGPAGPASPGTLARQLELQTGPPPEMTVANMLTWRCVAWDVTHAVHLCGAQAL